MHAAGLLLYSDHFKVGTNLVAGCADEHNKGRCGHGCGTLIGTWLFEMCAWMWVPVV